MRDDRNINQTAAPAQRASALADGGGMSGPETRAPAAGSPATAPPESLAGLIARYRQAVAHVNAREAPAGETDADAEAILKATVDPALQALIGVPAVTADDALAALDFLRREEVDLSAESGDGPEFRRVVNSLLAALHDYLRAAAEREAAGAVSHSSTAPRGLVSAADRMKGRRGAG